MEFGPLVYDDALPCEQSGAAYRAGIVHSREEVEERRVESPLYRQLECVSGQKLHIAHIRAGDADRCIQELLQQAREVVRQPATWRYQPGG